jgi:hypothetical protein
MASDVMTKPHQLIASDRVEGTAVRRPNGDMVGHIERLMIDKVTGRVSYAILSFGGFLGIGANLGIAITGCRLTVAFDRSAAHLLCEMRGTVVDVTGCSRAFLK